MKEYHFTIGQIIGIILFGLILGAGWLLSAYLYGEWKGYDRARAQIINEYIKGVTIERVK